MSIQSYRVPANDYTLKMVQKIASRVSKKSKIFRQKCFSPLSEPKNARKKMRLRAFSSLFDRINAIFSRITSHRQESPWFCSMSGTFALSANWIACDLWSSLRVCLLWFPQCFRSTNVFFCICLHSHALIRGLRVFEPSHLLLHLRLIPLILRDPLRNGGIPAPYW